MRLLHVVGARPQFVKLAPMAAATASVAENIVLHTGQHYDRNMSDLLFEELRIPAPKYNLGVGSGPQGEQTGRMLEGIERVLLDERPDGVIVYGDTNSTLAGALAAVKLHIPSIHVEAGFRSWNMAMPEEVNRIVADHTCGLLFAPTQNAVDNLIREGLGSITKRTGDIMVDTLELSLPVTTAKPSVAQALGIQGPYSSLTLHRPYTVDDPVRLGQVLCGLASVVVGQLVFAAHPRTQAIIQKHHVELPASVRVIPPQGYLEFLQLLSGAERVLTDSGGIPKEAYMLRKPCVILRSEYEFVEILETGWTLLAPPLENGWLERIASFAPKGTPPDIFGRNVAAEMRDFIVEFLEGKGQRTPVAGYPESRSN